MRVRPILFNTKMVQAILDGRKTATRRMLMPHNRKRAKEQGYIQGSGLWVDPSTDNGDKEGHIKDYSISSCWMTYSWYIEKYADYKPGDILYVRETWEFLPCIECMGEGECSKEPCTYEDKDSASEGCFVYREDYPHPERVCWRPSIHMPKAAARIWLKVTDVKVEQLQDISPEQLRREGMAISYLPEELKSQINRFGAIFDIKEKKSEFCNLWNSTLKKTDLNKCGWSANPWVWAIGFERCEKPEPCILVGKEPAEDKRPCIGYGDELDDESCELCKELCKGCRHYIENDI